jgi:predicted nuclease with TOPRIM domain
MGIKITTLTKRLAVQELRRELEEVRSSLIEVNTSIDHIEEQQKRWFRTLKGLKKAQTVLQSKFHELTGKVKGR